MNFNQKFKTKEERYLLLEEIAKERDQYQQSWNYPKAGSIGFHSQSYYYYLHYLTPKALNNELLSRTEFFDVLEKVKVPGFDLDKYILTHGNKLQKGMIQFLFSNGSQWVKTEESALFILKRMVDEKLNISKEHFSHQLFNATSLLFFPFQNPPLPLFEKLIEQAKKQEIELHEEEAINHLLYGDPIYSKPEVAWVFSLMLRNEEHLGYQSLQTVIDASVKLLLSIKAIKGNMSDSEYALLTKLKNYPYLPLKHSKKLKRKFEKLNDRTFLSEDILFHKPATYFRETTPIGEVMQQTGTTPDVFNKHCQQFLRLAMPHTIIPQWVWDNYLKDNLDDYKHDIKVMFAAERYLTGKVGLLVEYYKHYYFYLPEDKEDFKRRLICFFNETENILLPDNIRAAELISILQMGSDVDIMEDSILTFF